MSINKDTKSDRDLAALETKVRSTVQQQGITVKQFLRFSTKEDTYREQLMNVINTLNVQSNSDYIGAIRSLLESSLKRKDEEYRNIQQQINVLYQKKTAKQNQIQSNSRSIGDCCRNLKMSFHKHQNSIAGFGYGDEYYKMELGQKETYDRNVYRITEIVNRFSSQNNELLNIENQITTLGKQTEELKIDKKRIEQVTANLSRLIIEYSNKR